MEEKDIDDERREAAIASAVSLQSNFKPKGGVSSAQLSKFQMFGLCAKSGYKRNSFGDFPRISVRGRKELHKRRLQLKTKSKPKKRSKGLIDEIGKSKQKILSARESTINKESSSSLPQQEKGENFPVPKERKKLHWGLDTKERWEMKANM